MSDRPNLSNGDGDPLGALQRAWGSLEVPDPTPDVSDPATEAALDWMRAAWKEFEPPTVALPWTLRWRQPIQHVRRYLPLAAAASLVFIAGWQQFGTSPASSPGRLPLEVAEANLPDVITPTEPLGTTPEPTPTSDEVVTAQPTERVSVMDGKNHVIEHGSVRLMFLTPIDGPGLGLDNTTEK